MPRGVPHPPQVKAAAIAAVAAGERQAEVARRFGVSQGRLADWCKDQRPKFAEARYMRTREVLAELIFDTVVETLNALRVRARVTGSEDWVKGQSAAELAALDAAQWDRIIRVISGFRPVEQEPPALPE